MPNIIKRMIGGQKKGDTLYMEFYGLFSENTGSILQEKPFLKPFLIPRVPENPISMKFEIILRFANFWHIKFFGSPMSQEAHGFIRGLSWSLIGGIFASSVLLGLNIFAGRLMGPAEYGIYNLLLVVSQFLLIPILFGTDISGVRAIAQSKDKKTQSGNISALLFFVLCSSLLISLFYYFSSDFLSERFTIKQSLLNLALIFSVIIAVKSILDGSIRGLGLFRYQFFSKIIEVGCIVSFFLVASLFFQERGYEYYVYSLIIGGLVVILLYLKELSAYISRIDFQYIASMLSYGKIIIIASILGTLFNSLDKVILARYAGLEQLGIYGAYFMASTNLVAQLTQVFNNVFFPALSKSDDPAVFINKLSRIFKAIFLPCFVILAGIVGLIMHLFGNAYELSWYYILGFALLGSLQIVLTVNTSSITVLSQTLFKKYVIYSNILNIFHLLAYGFLIYFNFVTIGTILFFFITNVFITIYIQKRLLKSHLRLI